MASAARPFRLRLPRLLPRPFGVWLLSITAPDVARLAIALIALAAFGLMLVPAREGAIPGRRETVTIGVAAGLLTGFASMPGPPVVPFYLRRKLTPDVARASMLMVFFATAIAGSIASFALGVANLHLLWLSVLFYPALYIGTPARRTCIRHGQRAPSGGRWWGSYSESPGLLRWRGYGADPPHPNLREIQSLQSSTALGSSSGVST
jgi:hypothetical protein